MPSPLGMQLHAKALCAQWTANGMLLALGCVDGSVTIRDRAGVEKHKLDTGSSSVWSLAWSPKVSWPVGGGPQQCGADADTRLLLLLLPLRSVPALDAPCLIGLQIMSPALL